MIRTGIFGTHGHMEKFVSLLKEGGAQPVVLWDDHAEEGRKASEKTGIPFEEDYMDAVCSYEIEAAVITVPAYMHCELVKKLAERNIHIFLEKPLCTDLREAEEMVQAVHASEGKFFLSDPFVRSEVMAMKSLIDEGKLGEVTTAVVRISGRKNWNTFNINEQQGGIISSIGGHGLHIIQYLFGMPEKVISSLNDISGHDTEDDCTVMMIYPRLTVVLQASWVSGGNSSSVYVYGTKGFVRSEAGISDPDLETFEWIDREQGKMDIGLPETPDEHISYFLKMIREDLPDDIIGKDPLSNRGVSIDNAYELVKMIDMIYGGNINETTCTGR